jgi:hypothetical protein
MLPRDELLSHQSPTSGVLGALEDTDFVEEKWPFQTLPDTSFSDASRPSFEQSLSGVGGVSFAARRAVALSLTLRPILAPATVTPAIFISPFRHPVSPKRKAPRRGRELICSMSLLSAQRSGTSLCSQSRTLVEKPGSFLSAGLLLLAGL